MAKDTKSLEKNIRKGLTKHAALNETEGAPATPGAKTKKKKRSFGPVAGAKSGGK